MRNKHRKILEAIFENPIRTNIDWRDVVALLLAMGADVDPGRAGSRVRIVLGGVPHVLHKPHPGHEVSMFTIRDLRELITSAGLQP